MVEKDGRDKVEKKKNNESRKEAIRKKIIKLMK